MRGPPLRVLESNLSYPWLWWDANLSEYYNQTGLIRDCDERLTSQSIRIKPVLSATVMRCQPLRVLQSNLSYQPLWWEANLSEYYNQTGLISDCDERPTSQSITIKPVLSATVMWGQPLRVLESNLSYQSLWCEVNISVYYSEICLIHPLRHTGVVIKFELFWTCHERSTILLGDLSFVNRVC